MRYDLQTHRVAVQTDCNQSLPPIEGNEVQLQQVLVNLITNAIDSMATEDGDRVLSLRSKVYDSGSLMVSVEDVGKGVEPSAIDLIFKPQFTTKVHGMGMGLAICRSIIEAHGGQLWVTANLPRGAIFHFTLPAHRQH
jgi:signal transduction histidine kinase